MTGDMSDFKFYEQQHLFDVLVTGVYPSLTVSDVTGSGCLASISKKLLWKLFSVDRCAFHFSWSFLVI